jgi:hypothetical protein
MRLTLATLCRFLSHRSSTRYSSALYCGSFALYHQGVMTESSQELVIRIVPDSGSGELEGISGTLVIRIVEKKHFYDLEYVLR